MHPKGELRKALLACLSQGRSTRQPRLAGQGRRGRLSEKVSIHVRPPEVDDRLMPRHWESDLLKRAGNKSAVGVLVERSTRLLMSRMPNPPAGSTHLTAKLRQLSSPLRQTLTYD